MLYISTTSTWVKGVAVSTIHTREKGVMHTNNKHMQGRHYVHQTLNTWERIFRVSKQVQFFSTRVLKNLTCYCVGGSWQEGF